jgi:hypothetical protein
MVFREHYEMGCFLEPSNSKHHEDMTPIKIGVALSGAPTMFPIVIRGEASSAALGKRQSASRNLNLKEE